MVKAFGVVIAALLLAACSSFKLHQDFDLNRDFGRYQTWQWSEPRLDYSPQDPRLKSDLTEQRVTLAVADQLLQRGLRPAPAGTKADFKVRTWIILENRVEQYSTGYTPFWGGYWAPGPAGYGDVQTQEYQLMTLQIDLYDGQDGKLVWRGSAEHIMRNPPATPEKRIALIQQIASKILSQYPPRR